MSPKAPNLEPQNLTKHFNEALILSALLRGAKHGYQLALDIEERGAGRFGFKHGTLYPILHKLENDGLIRGDWLEEEGKRKRKSYRLTDAGRRRLTRQIVEWSEFFERFFNIVVETKR